MRHFRESYTSAEAANKPQIVIPNTVLTSRIENPARNCYRDWMAVSPPQKERPELRRRSQRVKMRIPVLVRPQTVEKHPVTEKTETLVVNAHGALLLLATEVAVDEFVVLQNLRTGEELLCRVNLVGPSFMGKTQVAVEFIKPAPAFWGITAPPKDWKSSRLPRTRA